MTTVKKAYGIFIREGKIICFGNEFYEIRTFSKFVFVLLLTVVSADWSFSKLETKKDYRRN